LPTSDGLTKARQYMEFRFPGMRGAPLLEARVCQYENTPDQHFLFDRHPQAGNVWLVGGGSGHGYKHGPAVGEKLANMILGKRPLDPFFSLASRQKGHSTE
jgi:sarcosine oxidase